MSSNPPGGPNFWQQAWQQITNSYGFFTNPIGGVLPLAQSSLTFANPATPGGQVVAKEAGAINTGVGNVTGAKLPGINIGVNIGGILKVAFGGLLILLALALAFLPEIGEAAAVAAGAPELAPAVGGALRGKPKAGVKRSANTLVNAMNRRAADRRARQVEARTDIRRSERKTRKLAPRETYEAAGLPDLYERRAAGTEPLSGQPRPRKPRAVRQPRPAAGPSPVDFMRPQGRKESILRDLDELRARPTQQRMDIAPTGTEMNEPAAPLTTVPPAKPKPPTGPQQLGFEDLERMRRAPIVPQTQAEQARVRRLADQPLTAPPTSTFEPGEQPRPSRVPGMLGVPSPIPRDLPQTQPTREGTQGGTLGMGPGATPTTEEYRQYKERERNATLRKQANEFLASARFFRQAADAAEREGNTGAARRLRLLGEEARQREIETLRTLLGNGGES